MITAAETRLQMDREGEHWLVPLMDFVDAFRRHPDQQAVAEPMAPGADPRLDALLAAVVESLCAEAGLDAPSWVDEVGPSPRPWFVSGLESLKAIALAESPLPFRRRRIFVLENFLSRA